MANDSVIIRISRDARDMLKTDGMTYTEVIKQHFNQTSTDNSGKIGPLIRNSGKQQGVTFISQSGMSYECPPITVNSIRDMLTNPYIVSKLDKRTLTNFPDHIKIEVLDPKQKVNEEYTHYFQNMCGRDEIQLNEKIIQADNDIFSYGMAIYNPVWVRKNGEIFIQALRHLPVWSFDTAPTTNFLYEQWSPILHGVILNENGEPEYWQRTSLDSLETELITNCMVVKNPKDEELAGNSKLVPLIQIIEMIKYCWNTDMQVIHRSGAPIFFLKITNPRAADDPMCGGISDVEFGNQIMREWSKEKQFILRDNMEIVPLNLGNEVDVLHTHDVLNTIIEDYFSISNMISKDGTLIGGSSIPELKLLNQAIRGLHNWLLKPFENLFNNYFYLNGFPDGWTCKITIPTWEEDKAELFIKQAQVGIQGQCVDLDDLRAKLDYEQADEKKKESIKEFWSSNKIVPVTQSDTNNNDNLGSINLIDNQKNPNNITTSVSKKTNKVPESEDDNTLNPVAQAAYTDFTEQIDILSKEIIQRIVL